jgi:glutathione peroxidase
MQEFSNCVVLVVNTASKCGFTPQYAGLETLYKKYKSQGFSVLGFPCNQFGAQEFGDHSRIAQFCSVNYGVTFPIFAKIDVNGPMAHPLFQYLKSAQKGIFGSTSIKWNFTKFLIGRNGEVKGRFAPIVKPSDLIPKINALL